MMMLQATLDPSKSLLVKASGPLLKGDDSLGSSNDLALNGNGEAAACDSGTDFVTVNNQELVGSIVNDTGPLPLPNGRRSMDELHVASASIPSPNPTRPMTPIIESEADRLAALLATTKSVLAKLGKKESELEHVIIHPPRIAQANVHANRVSQTVGWRNLFVPTARNEKKLRRFDPCIVEIEGKRVLKPPPEMAIKGALDWTSCLVGHFLGRKIPNAAIDELVNYRWDRFGHIKVSAIDDDFFVFKFENDELLNGVLNGGPWEIWGRHLVLRRWEIGMPIKKELLSKAPIWVNLYDVPFEYWNEDGLSYIASYLGSPLYMDDGTDSKFRLKFARICIEMEVEGEFPESISLENMKGDLVEIQIWYSWKPTRCSLCNDFDHHDTNCPKAKKSTNGPKGPKRVWVEKQKKVVTDDEGWINVSGKRKQASSSAGPSSSIAAHASSPLPDAGTLHPHPEEVIPPLNNDVLQTLSHEDVFRPSTMHHEPRHDEALKGLEKQPVAALPKDEALKGLEEQPVAALTTGLGPSSSNAFLDEFYDTLLDPPTSVDQPVIINKFDALRNFEEHMEDSLTGLEPHPNNSMVDQLMDAIMDPLLSGEKRPIPPKKGKGVVGARNNKGKPVPSGGGRRNPRRYL